MGVLRTMAFDNGVHPQPLGPPRPSLPRCPGCPVRPTARCVRRLCHLAGQPDWDRHIVAMSESLGGSAVERPWDVGARPRVGFWSPCMYATGGSERWHLDLIPRLDRSKVDYRGLAVLDRTTLDPGNARTMANYGRMLDGPEGLAELARECDILVVWGMPDAGCFLPEGSHRPFVVAVSHGDKENGYTQRAMTGLDRVADRYVAVAPTALGPVPAHRRARAVVIPNGIDLRRLANPRPVAETRARWRIPDGSKVVGYLGRMSNEKNPFAVAKAVAHLPPEWVGILVGDGWQYDYVRDFNLVTAPYRCYMAGHESDIASALAAMDCVLDVSIEEGFGYSMCEAAVAGRPLVVSPTGIAAKEAELFRCIPREAEGPELASAVLREIENTSENRSRRLELRRRIRQVYGVEAFACRWSDFLADPERAETAALKVGPGG
jgi:glycosyltransferase involved in cell wall biosynthesis